MTIQALYAGLQIGSALLAGKNERANAAAVRQVSQAQADARNLVTQSRNTLARERASTSRVLQSIANQRRADQLARRQASATAAIGSLQSAGAANRAQSRVVASMQLGQQAAQAAFAGIIESGPGLAESATSLRVARAEEASRRREQAESFYLREEASAAAGDIQAGLDLRPVFANVSYDEAVAQNVRGPNVFESIVASGVDFTKLLDVAPRPRRRADWMSVQGAGDFTYVARPGQEDS